MFPILSQYCSGGVRNLGSSQPRGGADTGPLADGTCLGHSGYDRCDLQRGWPVGSMGMNETHHGP